MAGPRAGGTLSPATSAVARAASQTLQQAQLAACRAGGPRGRLSRSARSRRLHRVCFASLAWPALTCLTDAALKQSLHLPLDARRHIMAGPSPHVSCHIPHKQAFMQRTVSAQHTTSVPSRCGGDGYSKLAIDPAVYPRRKAAARAIVRRGGFGGLQRPCGSAHRGHRARGPGELAAQGTTTHTCS